MSKHMYSTVNLSDRELKEQGNRLYNLRKYDDAINLYSKAIVSIAEEHTIMVVAVMFCLQFLD